MLLLADAYADPKKRSPLRPLLFSAVASLCAVISQAVLAAGDPRYALPRPIVLAGGLLCVLLIPALRLLFPAPGDLPQGAGGPAFWRDDRARDLPRISPWLLASGREHRRHRSVVRRLSFRHPVIAICYRPFISGPLPHSCSLNERPCPYGAPAS